MSIAYEIYNIEAVKENDKKDKEVIHIEYDKRGLKCLISYFPAYFKFGDHQTAHLAFHALSDGWDEFTSTGYRSNFLTVERDFKADKKEVIEFFENMFQEVDFDIEAPIQASLF